MVSSSYSIPWLVKITVIVTHSCTVGGGCVWRCTQGAQHLSKSYRAGPELSGWWWWWWFGWTEGHWSSCDRDVHLPKDQGHEVKEQCVYACMWVCVCGCVHVCMWVCVCMHVWVCACVHAIHACVGYMCIYSVLIHSYVRSLKMHGSQKLKICSVFWILFRPVWYL